MTIQVEVDESLVARFGAQALANSLRRMLAWQALSLRAQEVHKALKDADIDWEEMAENARQEVWDTYKTTHLKDVLPPEAFQ